MICVKAGRYGREEKRKGSPAREERNCPGGADARVLFLPWSCETDGIRGETWVANSSLSVMESESNAFVVGCAVIANAADEGLLGMVVNGRGLETERDSGARC